MTVDKLEYETKYELSSQGFDRICGAWEVRHRHNQLNVYYDAEWRLAECASTLRIRFDGDSTPMLTLKVPVTTDGAKRVMREFELPVPRSWSTHGRSIRPKSIDVERDLPLELACYLRALGITRVVRVGWVRNTRLVMEAEGGGCIELDRLELPDGSVFHEAEIEAESESLHAHLSRLVTTIAPEATPSRVSKFQRFRQAALAAR